jgi:hypothetical protein
LPKRLWGPPNLMSVCYREALCPGEKRPEHGADHSASSRTDWKEKLWTMHSFPYASPWRHAIYRSIYLTICLSIYISVYLSTRIYGSTALVDSGRFFSSLIYTQSVGPLERGISSSQGRNLHRTTQTQNKGKQTSMPRVEFEPTIRVFERAKTVPVVDRAAGTWFEAR